MSSAERLSAHFTLARYQISHRFDRRNESERQVAMYRSVAPKGPKECQDTRKGGQLPLFIVSGEIHSPTHLRPLCGKGLAMLGMKGTRHLGKRCKLRYKTRQGRHTVQGSFSLRLTYH